jgi:hypothetical protein
MRSLTHWLRRLSLVGAVLLPSFMATCSSGMSSLQIDTLNMPDGGAQPLNNLNLSVV